MKKEELIRRLELGGVKNRVVAISENFSLLVAERGGRVLGIFEDGRSDNLLWTAPQLREERTAADFLKSTAWNYGGDRLWFGPEIRYSVSDRQRFWETLHTPEAIDPGQYWMSDDGCTAVQDVTITTQDGTAATAAFRVWKTVSVCLDPLRCMPNAAALRRGVDFGGFTQTIRVEGSGAAVEPWSLLQVMPGGKIYIPMYAPERGTDYYEPAAPFETVREHCAVLEASGRDRYKVGYHAAAVTGRLGYACRWNGRCCLLVRNFPNDPEGRYEEEPPLRPGVRGFSVHIYNDGGPVDGFSEIECSLSALFGDGGRAAGVDAISTWLYAGEEASLKEIGRTLLGCEVEF